MNSLRRDRANFYGSMGLVLLGSFSIGYEYLTNRYNKLKPSMLSNHPGVVLLSINPHYLQQALRKRGAEEMRKEMGTAGRFLASEVQDTDIVEMDHFCDFFH